MWSSSSICTMLGTCCVYRKERKQNLLLNADQNTFKLARSSAVNPTKPSIKRRVNGVLDVFNTQNSEWDKTRRANVGEQKQLPASRRGLQARNVKMLKKVKMQRLRL